MRHFQSNVKLIKSVVIMKMELALDALVQMDMVTLDVLVNTYLLYYAVD